MEHRLLARYQYYALVNVELLNYIKTQTPTDNVFEIGAGKGQLTRYIKPAALAEINVSFHKYLNCPILYQDLFTVPLTQLAKYKTIVGNLPYKQTAKVLELVLRLKTPLCIFILQQQVAEKLVDFRLSRLKLIVSNCYKVTWLKTVSKTMFKPIPPVNGALVKLELTTMVYDPTRLQKLCAIFNYQRKKLKTVYRLLSLPLNLYTEKRVSELNNKEFDELYKSCFNQYIM